MNYEGLIFISIITCCVAELVSSNQAALNQNNLAFKSKHNILATIQNNPDNNKLAEYYDAIVKNRFDNLPTNLTENDYQELQRIFDELPAKNANYGNDDIRPCTCGVFLSNQIRKKQIFTNDRPTITQEIEKTFPCTKMGIRKCQNECFQLMIQYLPQSAEIICALVGEDIHKMRAHLFVQNCDSQWHNSNLSAGREYCCKDSLPYPCPLF